MTTTTAAPPTGTASGKTAPTPQGNKLPTIRYTLSQMRLSAGRLTAAGIAILISTAFVAITLLAGNVLTSVVNDTNAARYGDADVIVTTGGDKLSDDVDALRGLDGVTAAEPVVGGYLSMAGPTGRNYAQSIAMADDERLLPVDLVDGAWPSATDQVAIPDVMAERMKVEVGDKLTVFGWEFTDEEAGEGEETVYEVSISGTTEDPYGAFSGSGGAVVATAEAITTWDSTVLDGDTGEIMALLDPSALSGDEPTEQMSDALSGAVVSSGKSNVLTVDERATEITSAQTGDSDVVFLVFGMTFAIIALVVAGLVIANTFQVLVAQRTRTLALLRCIGAGRGQLYRSVLFEAFLLGVLASAGGLLVALLLGQTALWVMPQVVSGPPLPEVVEITPQVIFLPLLVGIVVTVAAALAPAMNATRVAPLAALRPAADPTIRKGAGRVRAVFATLLTLGGSGLLAMGVALGTEEEIEMGMLAAVSGGSIAFVGIILGAVFWLPKVTAFFGTAIGRSGPAAKLAAANTLRNPRRTSATASALLIGVTLIMTMATGAAAARQTSDTRLDAEFPMDIMVAAGATNVPDGAVETVAGAPGVDAAVGLISTDATTSGDEFWTVRGGDPAELGTVLQDKGAISDLDKLEPGSVLLAEREMEDLGVSDGDSLALAGPDGEKESFTVIAAQSPAVSRVMLPDDLRGLDGDAIITDVWASFDEGVDPADGLYDVREALSEDSLMVMSPASQRAEFEQVINVMLATIVALLAVAVVIAVIGVANTLSLSVIERRRESATLRAIGLSKSQLRHMLAVEGMLIAAVGAVLGILIGLAFGWAGAVSSLSMMGDVELVVPWTELVVAFVAAILAGLVASVAPARTALKASPVEALAAE